MIKKMDFQKVISTIRANEENHDEFAEAMGVNSEKIRKKVRSINAEYVLSPDTHTEVMARTLEVISEKATNSNEAAYMIFHILGTHFKNYYEKKDPIARIARQLALMQE